MESPAVGDKNPFGLKPTARPAAAPEAADAAPTVGETRIKGNPFGLSPSGESQAVAPQTAEKPIIDDVPKYIANAIAGGKLQELLRLDDSHWRQVDRNALSAIRSALGDPNQQELANQLQRRIGAAELRLFSQEMKTQ